MALLASAAGRRSLRRRRSRAAPLALTALLIACIERPAPTGRLYVTSGFTDTVLVLDAVDGGRLRAVPVDRRRGEVDEPHGVATAPDGKHWYLTLSHGDPTLWKFEREGDRLVGRVSLGLPGAARIGLTPDGRRAFVPDYFRSGEGRTSGLGVVSLDRLEVLARPTLCPAPHDAQVDPTGRRVAVACSLSDEIVMLDAEGFGEIGRFYVDRAPGPPGAPRFKPMNVAWSPGGDTLYVALHLEGAVRAFGSDGATLGTARVGSGPAQIALTPDGATLVVANRMDRSVSLVDAARLEERALVAIDRAHPHGVALDRRGQWAFVTCEGEVGETGGVVAIGVADGRIRWSVAAGVYTLGIAWMER